MKAKRPAQKNKRYFKEKPGQLKQSACPGCLVGLSYKATTSYAGGDKNL